MRDRLHVSIVILVILAVVLLPEQIVLRESTLMAVLPLVPQYAIGALPVAEFRQAAAVGRAVAFILALQPEGTYILTKPGGDDIVPMDVAHAAIALTKAGHLAEARAALDWMLTRQTRPDDPQAAVTKTIDGQPVVVDYTGSWYDHYGRDGLAKVRMTRGRGEGVGLMLVAVAAVVQEDPAYVGHDIAGEPVLAFVGRAVRYLTSPAIQKPDGRFHHRPDYRVSFNEEAARMALGLKLAAELLEGRGERSAAASARAHAALGFVALRKGEGLDQGMAYDYYAQTMWGLAEGPAAEAELASLHATGLVTPRGVRHYDWQELRARTLRDRLKWWGRGQVIAPSESFDWGIANLVAGRVETALELEAAWLPRQRADGGFAGGYLAGLRLPIGEPTSYSAARFILFERLLTDAVRNSRLA